MENPQWQPGITLADMEKLVILKCLRFHENNQRRTAQTLGVSVRTIANKLKEYGVRPVDFQEEEAQPNVQSETVPEQAKPSRKRA